MEFHFLALTRKLSYDN